MKQIWKTSAAPPPPSPLPPSPCLMFVNEIIIIVKSWVDWYIWSDFEELLHPIHHLHHHLLQHVPEGDGGRDGGSNVIAELTRYTKNMMFATYDKKNCPDTWLYLFGHGISQTQPMWGHTQNFSSFGPLILHLPGGAESAPPPSLKCVAGTPSLLGLRVTAVRRLISQGNIVQWARALGGSLDAMMLLSVRRRWSNFNLCDEQNSSVL